MRYYEITFIPPGSQTPLTVSSKLADGTFNTGALDVDFDLTLVGQHEVASLQTARLTIHGVAYADIQNASGWTNAAIQIRGGMLAGLPLTDPSQQGVLAYGSVFQAFGNWTGTDQSLTFMIKPPDQLAAGKFAAISANWLKGSTLKDALTSTLASAFPGVPLDVQSLNPALVLDHDTPLLYRSLPQFAQFLNTRSRNVVKDPSYKGVRFSWVGPTLKVEDGTGALPVAKQLMFQDMIGQPVWVSPFEIQAIFVLRGDLAMGDIVTLPPGLQSISASSATIVRDRTTLPGTFRVTGLRHVGRFRSPDGANWATVINLLVETSASGSPATGGGAALAASSFLDATGGFPGG